MFLWNTQFRADLPAPLTYKHTHSMAESKTMGKLYILIHFWQSYDVLKRTLICC